MPTDSTHIRTAQSCADDARQAVRDFCAQIHKPDSGLVLFFCSSTYDLDAVADEMNRSLPGPTVVGCTSAGGEIGPAGYAARSISGASLPVVSCSAVAGALSGLQRFEMGQAQRLAQSLLRRLEALPPAEPPEHTFALLLIDGLSKREEWVTYALQSALGPIPLIGGSAGDNLNFQRTLVFHDGAFHTDSAVLVLVRTRFPFRIFRTQHFVTRNERLVVTASDAANRVVSELNGRPAADEYARLIGARVEELTPERFAAAPVVVLIDGKEYVRSIQKVNPDHSLTLFAAIERGVVLRVADAVDIEEDLAARFDEIRRALGMPQAVFGFDCILRQLELSHERRTERVGDLLRRYNTVGFSTYGEQYGGVHVNQTFTGIAIGP